MESTVRTDIVWETLAHWDWDADRRTLGEYLTLEYISPPFRFRSSYALAVAFTFSSLTLRGRAGPGPSTGRGTPAPPHGPRRARDGTRAISISRGFASGGTESTQPRQRHIHMLDLQHLRISISRFTIQAMHPASQDLTLHCTCTSHSSASTSIIHSYIEDCTPTCTVYTCVASLCDTSVSYSDSLRGRGAAVESGMYTY